MNLDDLLLTDSEIVNAISVAPGDQQCGVTLMRTQRDKVMREAGAVWDVAKDGLIIPAMVWQEFRQAAGLEE